MVIDDEIEVLGKEFKDWVKIEYKIPWHYLSDTTLREAIEDYKEIR